MTLVAFEMRYPQRQKLIASYVAFVLGISALIGGCKKENAAPPPPPAVTVAKPIEREVIEWDEFTGHLDAVESVEVRARVSGLITTTPFEEGAHIRKGDLLFEIDVRPFQADLDAKLATVEEADAKLDLEQIDFNRIKAIPEESRTTTEFDTAAANVKQAQAELAAAKANVESARLNVEWCRVIAPIDGRISRKFVTVGNLISGGTGTGTLLTTITSVDPIYCYIDADEQSVLKYQRLSREGKRVSARDARIPCFLQLADEKNFPHEGVVDFVDNRVDPMTGTIRGRGIYPNPHGWLVPGFFARVRIPGSGRYQALLVPDSAVAADQDQRYLLIVKSDSTVERRSVTLGSLFGDKRAIESGIGPDDQVIINGNMLARPGAKVVPQTTVLEMDSSYLTSPGSPTTQALPNARNTTSSPSTGESSPSAPSTSMPQATTSRAS